MAGPWPARCGERNGGTRRTRVAPNKVVAEASHGIVLSMVASANAGVLLQTGEKPQTQDVFMKALSIRLLVVLSLVACTSAPPASAPTPVAAPTPAPAQADAPAVAATRLTESPKNWHLLDESTDRVPGISAERAMRELLASRQPRREVLVAVIDNGIDTAHADLRANLWTNPKETPGNGKDDDGNGFVDDTRGWNFIGGKDGKDVQHDTYELTREHARCTKGATGAGA